MGPGWDSFPENFRHWDETEEILEEENAIIEATSAVPPSTSTKKPVTSPKTPIVVERPKTNVLPPAAPKFCSQLF